MHINSCGFCTKKIFNSRIVLICRYAALDPYFIDCLRLPVSKQADTITGRHNLIEIFFQGLECQIKVNMLTYLECRFNCKRNTGDHTDGSKAYYSTQEQIAILFLRQFMKGTICSNKFNGTHSRR